MRIRSRQGRVERRRGVTLLEVMIAISVLLITLAATTAGQLSSRNLTDTAAESSTAMSDLRACMEQLLLEDLDAMVLPGSDFPDGGEVTEFNVVTAGSSLSQGDVEDLNDAKAPLVLNLPEGRIVVDYPNYDGGLDVPDPLEIRLTYSWRTRQPTRAVDDGLRHLEVGLPDLLEAGGDDLLELAERGPEAAELFVGVLAEAARRFSGSEAHQRVGRAARAAGPGGGEPSGQRSQREPGHQGEAEPRPVERRERASGLAQQPDLSGDRPVDPHGRSRLAQRRCAAGVDATLDHAVCGQQRQGAAAERERGVDHDLAGRVQQQDAVLVLVPRHRGEHREPHEVAAVEQRRCAGRARSRGPARAAATRGGPVRARRRQHPPEARGAAPRCVHARWRSPRPGVGA